MSDRGLRQAERDGSISVAMLLRHGQLVGRRVRLTGDADRFPHFIAHEGSAGIVTCASVSPHGSLYAVELDDEDKPEGSEEWGGEVHWYDVDEFLEDVELTGGAS